MLETKHYIVLTTSYAKIRHYRSKGQEGWVKVMHEITTLTSQEGIWIKGVSGNYLAATRLKAGVGGVRIDS